MTIAPAAPAAAAAPAPSLWQLGIESQELQRDIETLALQLDTDDPARQAEVTEQLETLLAAEADQQQALERKADAYCWVIDNLRGQALYRQQQAERLKALADADLHRADKLQESLITVLTRLQPGETRFNLPNHRISSRRSEGLVIDEEALIPPSFILTKTTESVDKAAIKAAIKAGQQVPGAHVEERRNWAIK